MNINTNITRSNRCLSYIIIIKIRKVFYHSHDDDVQIPSSSEESYPIKNVGICLNVWPQGRMMWLWP